MTPEIRVVVVGYGPSFGMGRSHLRRIHATKGLRCVAVCDVDAERRAAARHDFPEIATFADLDAVVGRSAADLAVIVTPNDTHATLGLRCLRAGMHVVLEKPMCIDTAEADALIAAASDAKAMLTVYHIRRLDRDFLSIKAAVQANRIGRVKHVEVARTSMDGPPRGWRADRARSGGAIYDWGSHLVDWALQLIGGRRPRRVCAFFSATRGAATEERMDVHLDFGDGVTARLHLDEQAAAPQPAWRILGDAGGLRMDSPEDETIQLWPAGGAQTLVQPIPVGGEQRRLFYENVVAHITQGAPLLVAPAEARAVIAVLGAVNRSAASGRTVSLLDDHGA